MLRFSFTQRACFLPSLTREYAKHAKKGNKHASGTSVKQNDAPAVEFSTDKYTTRMTGLIDKLKNDLASLRLGRANPSMSSPLHKMNSCMRMVALLDTVKVTVPGQNQAVKLSSIAQVIVKDPQTLHVMTGDKPV